MIKKIKKKNHLPYVNLSELYNEAVLKGAKPEQPSVPSSVPSDVAVSEPKPAQQAAPTSQVSEYDRLCNKHLQDAVKAYALTEQEIANAPGITIGSPSAVQDKNNQKIFDTLFDKAPPKKGDESGAASKAVGYGELALYYLLKKGGSNIVDNRSAGNADLLVNGNIGIEIKSYGRITSKITIGRFKSAGNKVGIKLDALLNAIFSLSTLEAMSRTSNKPVMEAIIEAGSKTTTVVNTDNWTGEHMKFAFEHIRDFNLKMNNALEQAAAVGFNLDQYPVFTTIKNSTETIRNYLKQAGVVDGSLNNPELNAAKIINYVVRAKLAEKPGDQGYIVNVKPPKLGGTLEWYQVNLSNIEKASSLDNGKASGASLSVSINLFNKI